MNPKSRKNILEGKSYPLEKVQPALKSTSNCKMPFKTHKKTNDAGRALAEVGLIDLGDAPVAFIYLLLAKCSCMECLKNSPTDYVSNSATILWVHRECMNVYEDVRQ